MKGKLLTIFMLTLASAQSAFAQAVEYSYDAAGNRTRREIIIRHVKEREATSTKDIIAEDLSPSVRIEADSKVGTVTVVIDGLKPIDKCDISLFNTMGVNLLNLAADSPSTVVDLRPYPDGAYVVSVTLNGRRDTWKVSKNYK